MTPLTLSICTFELVVDRMTTKNSSGSIIESSLVAIVIVSSVLPGPKFKSGSGSASKSASLALTSKTVTLNKMWEYNRNPNIVPEVKAKCNDHFVSKVK